MKRITSVGTSIAIIGSLACASVCRADPVPPVQQVTQEQTTSAPPNVGILTSGIIGLVGSYVPSVIVAAANNESYDDHLYIPVVGPWLDLGSRPGCGGAGQSSCGAETGFKTLLVVDGAVQGLAAVAVVVGLFTPETRTTVVTTAKARKPEKPSVHFTPARVGDGGYGMAALGKF